MGTILPVTLPVLGLVAAAALPLSSLATENLTGFPIDAPASEARAQDIIGIYFDWSYSINCRSAEVGEYVGAVMMLTNVSAEQVAGWECSVRVTGAFLVQYFLHGDAIDHGEGNDNFIVTVNPPHFTYRPVLLLGINVLAEDLPVTYRVGPANPSGTSSASYYTPDGEAIPMNAATGDFALPLAVINADCITPSEATTWGVVKSLYR